MTTVQDLLELEAFQTTKIIAGFHGLDHTVENIMVMEAPDVEKWLSPNEMLLSSLYALSDFNDDEILAFLRKLRRLNCAGLVIKTNRLVKEIPTALVEGCNKENLALLEISADTKYHTIIFEVMQYLFNQTNLLLERYRKINEEFITQSLKGNTVETIVQLAGKMLDKPVHLFQKTTKGIHIEATSQHVFQDFQVLSAGLPVEKKDYMNYDYFFQQVQYDSLETPCRQLYVRLPRLDNKAFFLGITENDETISPSDFMAIENAVNFLQMEFIKAFAIKEVETRYKSDLFDDLITGRVDSKERLHKILQEIHLEEDGTYRFVVIQLLNKQTKSTALEKDVCERLLFKLMRLYPRLVYRVKSDRIICIVNAGSSLAQLKQQLQQLLNRFVEKRSAYYYRVGISESCSIHHFSDYSIQALKIVQIAASIYQTNYIYSHTDLGIYRFLLTNQSTEDLLSFVPEALKLLKKEAPDLVESLRIYLDNNQNAKQAASQLFIHPKTMAYRLKKIQLVMGSRFEDMEELLQLQIGLRVLKILEEKVDYD